MSTVRRETCCVLLVALACLSASAQELQWTRWAEEDGGNGHYYAVLTDLATWDEQQAAAQAMQAPAYLATITSAEEQALVMSVIAEAEAEARSTTDFYWFGLVQDPDAQEPGEGWGWVTGEPFDETSYQNWGSLEPNNYLQREHVGAIRIRGMWGDWIDGWGEMAHRAVIERGGGAAQDTTPPEIGLDAPDPAVLPWVEQPTPVTISGRIADDDSGVKAATVTVTDEYGELDAEYDVIGLLDKAGDFAMTIEVLAEVEAGDADGRSYEFALSAVDNAGNEAKPISVTVLAPADTTPPTLSLDSPEPPVLPRRRPFRLKPVKISGKVTDDHSGVASATLIVEDEYGRRDQTIDITEMLDDEGFFEVILKLSSWVKLRDRNGREYEISLTAIDRAGNEAGPETVIVKAPHPARRPWRRWRTWR